MPATPERPVLALPSSRHLLLAIAALSLIGVAIGGARAQDAAAPSAEPTPIYQPRAADLEPLASKGLMLDVVDTGKRLIAVGDRGHILASIDGQKWAQVSVPVRSALTAVRFVDAEHGWAVGHDAVVVATVDGGKTWQLQNFQPELEKPLLDIEFLDANTGFAVGGFGLVLRTEDGGGNWEPVSSPAFDTDELNLYSITRLADGDLLVTGEQGRLVLSSDRGRTWKRLKSPVNSTLFGAVAVPGGGALVCGLRGKAYLTRDVRAGAWRALDTGTSAAFYGCTALDRARIALVGDNGTIVIADPASLATRKLAGESGTAYSSATLWQSSLVVSGERGLKSLGRVR